MCSKSPMLFALLALLMNAGCSSIHTNKPLPSSSSAAVKYRIVQVTSSINDVPKPFLDTMYSTLDLMLRTDGLLDSSYATRDIFIDVTDYRMRNPTARLMLGLLAGDDHATSSVIVRDSVNQSIIGELDVTTRNVFIFGSEYEVARDHGQDIADALMENIH